MSKTTKTFFILIIILAAILRFYKLGINPPAISWDEASLGYNSFTIATSLHDEHGEFLPLARFKAFGDNKPPGYIYTTVPSILLFGLNEFSLRLPSAISGLLLVAATYFLVIELFQNKKVALISSFLLAISPWGVHFSRAAFEANLAAFFNLLGVYFFFISLRKKWMLFPSVLLFVFSFYTFNANRIIAPLLLLGLFIMYAKNIFFIPKYSLKKSLSGHLRDFLYSIRWILASIVVAVLLLQPSISYLKSRESKIRFQEVSIFNNLEPIKLSNSRIEKDGGTLLSRIIHNRRVLFTVDFLKHYFDNFSPRFLFTHGDVNPRLHVQSMGQLYAWSLPFFVLGLLFLIYKRERALKPIILWMLIVTIPAGVAKETPHALRILSILPTYQIIIAYGLYQFILELNQRFVNLSSRNLLAKPARRSNRLLRGRVLIVICFLLSANIFYYLHDYYIHFPVDWSSEWQYGYKQMVNFVSSVEDNYDHIFVTNSLGRPYIFFAFYKRIDADSFIKKRKAERDYFGFWEVSQIGKIRFNFNDLEETEGKILTVTTPSSIPSGFKLIKKIQNLSGDDVFLIGENK